MTRPARPSSAPRSNLGFEVDVRRESVGSLGALSAGRWDWWSPFCERGERQRGGVQCGARSEGQLGLVGQGWRGRTVLPAVEDETEEWRLHGRRKPSVVWRMLMRFTNKTTIPVRKTPAFQQSDELFSPSLLCPSK